MCAAMCPHDHDALTCSPSHAHDFSQARPCGTPASTWWPSTTTRCCRRARPRPRTTAPRRCGLCSWTPSCECSGGSGVWRVRASGFLLMCGLCLWAPSIKHCTSWIERFSGRGCAECISSTPALYYDHSSCDRLPALARGFQTALRGRHETCDLAVHGVLSALTDQCLPRYHTGPPTRSTMGATPRPGHQEPSAHPRPPLPLPL